MKTLSTFGFYALIVFFLFAIWCNGATFQSQLTEGLKETGTVNWGELITDRLFLVFPVLFILAMFSSYRHELEKERGGQ